MSEKETLEMGMGAEENLPKKFDQKQFEQLQNAYWESGSDYRQESKKINLGRNYDDPKAMELYQKLKEDVENKRVAHDLASEELKNYIMDTCPFIESLGLQETEIKSIYAFITIGGGFKYFNSSHSPREIEGGKVRVLNHEEFIKNFKEWRSSKKVNDNEYLSVVKGPVFQNGLREEELQAKLSEQGKDFRIIERAKNPRQDNNPNQFWLIAIKN